MSETPHQLAQRLAKDAKHPQVWAYYLLDVLKAMERQAAGTDPDYPEGYEEMLRDVSGAISTRLKTGEWVKGG